MALPTTEGRYLAFPNQWTVSEEKGKPTFICKFDLFSFFNGEAWMPCSDLQITGYFYLYKNDGTANEMAINSIMDALGWEGTSLAKLAEWDWSQTEVQLSLRLEEYNGKHNMKVAYLNPKDWTPSGVEKDPVVIQSLEQKYGAQLRALNGGKKPAAKPANGTPAPAPTSNQAAMRAAYDMFGNKWSEYVGANPDEASQRDDKWKAAVKEFFGANDPKTANAEMWAKCKAWLEKEYSVAIGGGIPF